ncbi:MAG: alpha/beta hydrolase [Candidatus Thorarchaeota archaeon]
MNSEQIKFKVGESELSGILEKPRTEASSVILVLHPHPLDGGDMYNPVVSTLVSTFLEAGFATFRFDFRGANNRSDYAGIPGAVDDTTAASKVLRYQGLKLAGLAGYSFGGSTALRYCTTNKVDFVISVSSSLALFQEGGYQATQLSRIEFPVLLIHGTSDLTAPFENLTNISSQISGEVKCVSIENEDHFYHHSLTQVQNEVKKFMETM